MSSFLGLNIALKGLYASQNSIYTVGHNISNADTTGYSRQVTYQQASTPLKVNNTSGMIGTGVYTTGVKRIRDLFLDNRYWDQNANYGEWNIKSNSMSELEAIMDETSEDGLNGVLSEFAASLEELYKDPESTEIRTTVVQNASALCQYLNNAASTLNGLREEYNANIKIKVNQVNSLAQQISSLNEQIYKAELDGSTANDLRDQRTLLIDELSALADIDVNEYSAGTLPNGKEDSRLQITINGQTLVNHFQVNELECYKIDDDGAVDDGMYGIRWKKTGEELKLESGEINAYLELRDGTGESGEYKGIPYYTDMLDNFARTLAKAFNEGIYSDGVKHCSGHADGTDLNGGTGTRFFTYNGISSDDFIAGGADTDSRYAYVTASNISISSDVEEDTDKLAAASSSGEAGNGENAGILLELFSDNSVFEEGMPEDYVNTIVSNMGVCSSFAARMLDNHKSILNAIDTNRMSVSGVSLDEETTNLIKYQQTYNAAAKVISVLDELLDVTINSMGV
ncbi:MAG TPA: flagellar hook-associated protein FlgK [Clostridia bacterium]|nr:flagellar hook-associated protein FlgK [Clostridia bacterium]